MRYVAYAIVIGLLVWIGVELHLGRQDAAARAAPAAVAAPASQGHYSDDQRSPLAASSAKPTDTMPGGGIDTLYQKQIDQNLDYMLHQGSPPPTKAASIAEDVASAVPRRR